MSDTTHSDEDLLRRGLHELADADGSAGAQAVDTVLAKGRRARRVRRAAVMCSVAVLVAGGTGLGLHLTDTSPSRAPDSSVASTAGDPPLEPGTAMPEIGVTYRYALPLRCDLDHIVLGGKAWTTKDSGLAHVISWAVPFHKVYLTRTDADTVRITPVAGGPSWTYHPHAGTKKGAPSWPTCLNDSPGTPGAPGTSAESERPETGVHYVHGLVECGPRYHTFFGGREWISDKETSLIEHRPLPDGRETAPFTVPGEMTLTSPDKARFELPGHAPITFRPYDGERPICA
ncbi:hypothetical protein OG729_16440 [Streptomyces sp. NBC_00210]|uniref:hypothetical protein n=1 Tax=unclassified Streptomyces TaxID=2593676 RepID=UPI00324D385C